MSDQRQHIYLNNNSVNINLISGILTQPINSFSAKFNQFDNACLFSVPRGTSYNTSIPINPHYANNMRLNYINIEDIDVTGGDVKRKSGTNRTDTTINSVPLTLPFIFPLFLGDLTTHGITHAANRNDYDANFYEDSFFNTHNADAVEIFYDNQEYNSDVYKESVGMINTNMQYCMMTQDTLHQYFIASNEWYQKDTGIINANVQEDDRYRAHVSQRGSNTATPFNIFKFDTIRDDQTYEYSTLNTVWTELSNDNDNNTANKAIDTLLFRYYSNRFNETMNFEVQRGTTYVDTDGGTTNLLDGGTRVNFNSIDLHSVIESGDEFLYASYIANVSIEVKNTIICGIGSYPKLLNKTYGLAIEYITKLQSFLYQSSTRRARSRGNNTIMTKFEFNDLSQLPKIEYNIPMVAKFKCNYNYSRGFRQLRLELIDGAAMNQFITNTTDTSNNSGKSVYDGLEDKQFVKAPFKLGEEAYQTTITTPFLGKELVFPSYGDVDKTTMSSLPMPYLQYMTNSSILDVDNNRFVVAMYISKAEYWKTISPLNYIITPGYEAQVYGDMIAINVYDTGSTFNKLEPTSYIAIDRIQNLDSMNFIMHDGKYILSTLANKTGVVRELTYDGVTWTNVEIFNKTNLDSLNIAGLKDGELE